MRSSGQVARAMVLHAIHAPLVMEELVLGQPSEGQVRLKVEACGVCRTDLHVVSGELPDVPLPMIPGHEVVGIVDAVGPGVTHLRIGDRVGAPWLGHTCGVCRYCRGEQENLCDAPLFNGYTRPGGFASHMTAEADYCISLSGIAAEPKDLAPLLCAGLIGWRSLVKAGESEALGLYGFGAAAHIIAQIAIWQGRRIYAFTAPGDRAAQTFALSLGIDWAGDSDELPPAELDAAILFAPVGPLVPMALRAVRKGGAVVCAGIHMSDIPTFPYRLLWEERRVLSVANLTRNDGREFFSLLSRVPLKTTVHTYPLDRANEALADLRRGAFEGAAVLIP